MARYEITGPDGKRYEITAPDGVSESEVLSYFQANAPSDQEPVGRLESAGRGALQGVTLGFGDEIYGAAKGAYDKVLGSGDYSGTYARERDAVRAANDKAQKDNPGTFLVGELAGSVALPFGMAKAGVKGVQAANAGLKARSVAAAKEGAAYGGAYGFGKGEGSAEDQALSTLGGAATGGTIGAAVPAAVAVGDAVLRAPMQAMRVAAQPRSVAAEKMVEAFARDAGHDVAVGNPVMSAALNLGKNGDNAMILADMGGENVRNLVRAANNMPNARAERFDQVLNRRNAVEGRRLSDVLENTLAGGRDFEASLDRLISQRSQQALPNFQRAYAAPWRVKGDSDLANFLQRGYMRRIVEKTQASIEGMTGSDSSALKPWEFLHRVKMEINREIGRMKRGQQDSAANWTLSDLTQMNKEYGALLAKENPSLGYALSKYSDRSQLIGALEDGADDFFKLSPSELSKKLRTMPEQAREMYRVGAARAQIAKISSMKTNRDTASALYNSDDMGQRLKAVFPEGTPQRGQFMRAINNSKKMAETRRAAQGNSTTAKQLTQAQEAGRAAQTAAQAVGAIKGSVPSLVALMERGGSFASGITPGVAAEILNLSMSKGGSGLAANSSRAIHDAFARGQARNLRQRQLSRALTPPLGMIGSEAYLGRQ